MKYYRPQEVKIAILDYIRTKGILKKEFHKLGIMSKTSFYILMRGEKKWFKDTTLKALIKHGILE